MLLLTSQNHQQKASFPTQITATSFPLYAMESPPLVVVSWHNCRYKWSDRKTTFTYFCQWVGGKNPIKHLLFSFETPKLQCFWILSQGPWIHFVHLTLSASTLYVPGTMQGIRDTIMTKWSLPLITKPGDVTDKNAELRHRGKRKTGR